MRLSQGAVETLASKLGLRAIPLQIQTPTTVIGVRGTRFRIAQETATANARAEVMEGVVRADNTVQQSGTAQFDLGTLQPGNYYLRLTTTHPPAVSADSETYRLYIPTGWGSTILDIESALQPLRP